MTFNVYDVIIVGAGPAGSTLSYLLKKYGFNIQLIDKARFPRNKLCAGGLSDHTYRLIKKIFNLDDKKLSRIISYKTKNFRIYYRNKLIFKGKFRDPIFFVDRKRYDFFLLNLVKKMGVKILEEDEVIDFNPFYNVIETRSNKKFKGKIIVGADGVYSIIRRNLPNFNFDKWKKQLGITAQISFPKQIVKEPNFYFGFVNLGYGWLFPFRNKTLIGLINLNNEKNKNILYQFRNFLNTLKIKVPQKIEGYFIPTAMYSLDPIFRSTLLIGDAAGFVDPISGEGIFYAHKSAEIAAEAIYLHLRKKYSLKKTYLKLLNESILPRLKYNKKIRNTLYIGLKIVSHLPFPISTNILQFQGIKYIKKSISPIKNIFYKIKE